MFQQYSGNQGIIPSSLCFPGRAVRDTSAAFHRWSVEGVFLQSGLMLRKTRGTHQGEQPLCTA